MSKSEEELKFELHEKSDLLDDNDLEKGEDEGTAGFALSVFNLMNAILGSGILGLAYAMTQLGIGMFFLICGTVAALAFYAIILMLNMCKKTGAKVRRIHSACFSFLCKRFVIKVRRGNNVKRAAYYSPQVFPQFPAKSFMQLICFSKHVINEREK
jgi:hypothetical protein